jgi:hypothetical protein
MAVGWMTQSSIPGSGMVVHVLQKNPKLRGPPFAYSLRLQGSFPGVKRTGRQADHWPESSAEVKN